MTSTSSSSSSSRKNKIVDVKPDGNCFFRSFVGYFKDNNLNIDKIYPGCSEDYMCLRKAISQDAKIDKNKYINSIFNNLNTFSNPEDIKMIIEDLNDYMVEAVKYLDSYQKFKSYIAKSILKDKEWAAQIEIDLVRFRLEKHGMKLEIIKNLKSVNRLKFDPKVVVLNNISDVHYQYVKFGHIKEKVEKKIKAKVKPESPESKSYCPDKDLVLFINTLNKILVKFNHKDNVIPIKNISKKVILNKVQDAVNILLKTNQFVSEKKCSDVQKLNIKTCRCSKK